MMRPGTEQQVSFSISHLEAWAPGVTTKQDWHEWANGARAIGSSGEPALQQMQPLLRRHAGRLGRLACSVAYDSLRDERDVPMVFSSRYGDVGRSVELLTALAAHSELSPATFGLSVHNAIPGLFSMARREAANTITLAAGHESAEFGMLEACTLVREGAEQVLLVVADVPLPAVYSRFADTTSEAFGWSCLVSSATGSAMHLEWADSAPSEPSSVELPTAILLPGGLAVLLFLLGTNTELCRTYGARTWRWRRDE